MNEYHLLQPTLKEENCYGCDTNIVVNEIYQPSSLDNIPSAIDHERRFTSNLTTSSTNITHDVSQAANHTCEHYTESRHLDNTNNAKHGLESITSDSELSSSPAEVAVGLETELLSLVAELFQDRLREAKYCERCCHDTYSKEIECRIGCEDPAKNIPSNNCVQIRQKGNTTSGSAQRKQSARNQDQRHQRLESCDAAKVTYVTADCHVSGSPAFPELNVDADLKQSHLFPGEKANVSSTFTNLSAARTGKSLLVKEKASHQLYRESMVNYIPANYWERQKLTTVFSDQDTLLCPTTRHSWQTAARDSIINPVQLADIENQVCWEQSGNNSSGGNIACDTSVHQLNEFSLCRLQPVGNYVNPDQLAGNENYMCWEQGCNNSSACNIAPYNSVHQLCKFSFCRLQPVGHYISNRKNETGLDDSVINEPVAADCSDIHPYLGLPLNDPEKKINNELVTFNKLITRRLASSENIERRLRGECSALEENVLDGLCQTQDPRLQPADEPHQRAGSIHLSPNQRKGSDNAYGNLLDTSNYIRTNERKKDESQPFLSFSKPIPAGDFDEIIQTSKGSLALFPNDRFCNNERIKNLKLRRPIRVAGRTADMKEAPFCHMMPPNSKNQPSFHSLTTCVSPVDNKDLGRSCLPYPLSYTRMESAMEQTSNPLQYINDDNKTIKYQRHKHSRSCRRRFGIDGTACCFMCLPEMPLDEHTLCKGNKTGMRTSMKKHKNSRNNRSKYLTQRSANNRLGRTYGRSINTKLKQTGRRRRQHSRSTSTGLRRRRISKNTGNRAKRRRCTSTYSRNRRISENTGNRAKRRRCTSSYSRNRRISKYEGNRAKRRRRTSTDSRNRRISKKEGNRAKRRRCTSTDSRYHRISKNTGNRAKRRRCTSTDSRYHRISKNTGNRAKRRRCTSTDSRNHRISKNTGNRAKRRRCTSTDSRHRRISKKEGNRAKRRRTASTRLRRRSRGSTNSGRTHRNKPRSAGLRRLIRQPRYKSKVYRHRKPKGTGLHSSGRRTRKTR